MATLTYVYADSTAVVGPLALLAPWLGVHGMGAAGESLNPTHQQKKLDQDYADFLVEYEAGRVQGTFLAWMHETGRNGITIPMTRAERNSQTG